MIISCILPFILAQTYITRIFLLVFIFLLLFRLFGGRGK